MTIQESSRDSLYRIAVDDLEDLYSYVEDLMSSMPEPVYAVNPQGIIIDANRALQRMTGLDMGQILGSEQSVLFGDPKIARKINSETLEKGSLSARQLMLKASQGKSIPVCLYSRTRSGDPGDLPYVVALIDITEQRRAEERARKSARRLLVAMENTIEAMVLMTEMRDPYTAGHQRRVARLACAMAELMRFTPHHINGLRLSCLIHDVGKIQVPSEVLTNPNKLSVAEFEMIKMHPLVGYEILKNIRLPWPISTIVLQHHEREDGSGYPDGIKGDKILLDAKILAVADVVEAMASHRPYRPALGVDKALAEVSSNRGAIYYPPAVDACVDLFTNKGFKLD
jgi:PAS domain S-box-containing protein